MSSVDISYIVICYNSETHVAKCMTSILNQTHTNYEIIVVDNNSVDKTKLIVEDFRMKNNQIKLISNSKNIGYGNAISMATKICNGEFLAILNADTFLDSQWAKNILDAFKDDNEIMSASGTILFPNGELQSTGGMMDKYGAIVHRGSKLFHSRNINENTFFYNDGSAFVIRQKILHHANFDPNLFLYYEDVDLSWKIRKLGYKVEYIKDAISYHDSGHSSSDMSPFKFYYLSRNRIYVCQKNYSPSYARTRITISLLLIFINAIYYDMTRKQKGYLKNFIKALHWNLTNMSSTLQEQKRLQLACKIPDEELDNFLIKKSIEFSIIRHQNTNKTK